MALGKPPAYQRYAKDFLTGTMTMSLGARGLYATLLDYQWDAAIGTKCGGIPDDVDLIARIASCERVEAEQYFAQIRTKFIKENDGFLRHPKLKKQWREMMRRRKLNQRKGKKGGEARSRGLRAALAGAKPEAKPRDSSPISDLRSSDLVQPPNPPAGQGGLVSTRKPSHKELATAEQILATTQFVCPHGAACDSKAECLGRIVQTERQKMAAGQAAAGRVRH